MRYLPGSENSGAASLWSTVCEDNDGGKGNGQYLDDRKATLNDKLVTTTGNALSSSEEAQGGKTTTHFQYSASFGRAVFTMTFDWGHVEKPTKDNHYGLDSNPCWPNPWLHQTPATPS